MAETYSLPEKNKQPPARKRAARPAVRWGIAALIAVSAAALTAQTRPGAARLEIALAGAREPSRLFAQAASSSVPANRLELVRLSAAVRELSADRDRLKARLASLERALDDTTGTITRQVKEVAVVAEAAAKKQAATSAVPAANSPTMRAAAPVRQPDIISMPLIAVPSFSLKPSPPYGPTLAQWSNQFVLAPHPAASAHVASLVAHNVAKSEDVAPAKEFAADVGGSATVAALWEQWVAIKASYGPLLTGLEPRYRRHGHEAGPLKYRLLVGPFADGPSANRLCSILATVHVDCHATTFDGAHLAAQ
ncbi:MAG TPA: hypothetical protein VFL51_07095 [Pseudolabrys sp.]|nr:hypothetical protein [Pseudolabrys sp.]